MQINDQTLRQGLSVSTLAFITFDDFLHFATTLDTLERSSQETLNDFFNIEQCCTKSLLDYSRKCNIHWMKKISKIEVFFFKKNRKSGFEISIKRLADHVSFKTPGKWL